MEWVPHVTVATVVERDGKFLIVEELCNGALVYNQPAGHLDPDETLQQAAIRETLEETGWEVELLGVSGVALYTSEHSQTTYNRTTFYARALKHHPDQPLDKGIKQALWLSVDELAAAADKLRSPLVLETVQHYLKGHRYPLDIIYG